MRHCKKNCSRGEKTIKIINQRFKVQEFQMGETQGQCMEDTIQKMLNNNIRRLLVLENATW
jgi:hypothetical protein